MMDILPTPPVRECGIALKEWAGICQALGEGRQILLLRKGGLSDSTGPSFLRASQFWLYPTATHEADQGLRPEFARPAPIDPASRRQIQLLASVDLLAPVRDVDQACRLAEQTAWTTETVLRRFHYRSPGLWAILTRVYRIEQPWVLPADVDDSGCSSWITLTRPVPVGACQPVLDEPRFQALRRQIAADLPANGIERP